MGGASIVSHGGKSIIFVDFKNCDEKQSISVIAEGVKLIRVQPEKSALVLCDFTNASHAPQLLQPYRDFVGGNSPYVKASAILGLTGMARVLYDGVTKLAGRSIPAFDEGDQAKDWLIAK